MCRADDDRVARDHRRCVQPDFGGGFEILVDVLFQVDDTGITKALDPVTRLGVEGHHLVARRDIKDDTTPTVLPVREPAAGQLARRRSTAFALVEPMHPEQFACLGIERDYGTSRAGRRVEHAIHHQGRGLEVTLGPRTEVIGVESPGQVQIAEIFCRDLVERRVALVGEVAAIRRPLP